jgi:hypothetical protein
MIRPLRAGWVAAAMLALAAGTAAGAVPKASDAADHRASPPGGGVRDEPSVAIHPTRPNVMATAANDNTGNVWGIGVYASRDGGLTYRGARMPLVKGTPYGSDPHLAYDRHGRLYALYLSYAQDRSKGGLVIARSDDGGWRWPAMPTVVRANHREEDACTFADFPAMAVDQRPGHETVYAVWQELRYTPPSTCATWSGLDLYLSRSRDGGRTWSPARLVEVVREGQAYIPTATVGPDGSVFVTYDYAPRGAGPGACPSSLAVLATGVSRSTDGGRTFRPTEVSRFCAPGTAVGVNVPTFGAVSLASSTGALYRLPANSNTVVNPRTGHLLTVVGAQDPVTSQQRVLTFRSTDHGRTWRAAGVVPSLPAEHQQFPRLAVGKDGRISLLWLAQLPGGVLQASHTWSFEEGLTWRPVERIASMPSPITHPNWVWFIGDYLGNTVGADGRAHPVWTDLREWNEDNAGGTLYTRALAP